MHHVANPKQVDFVTHAVCPVVSKINPKVKHKNGEGINWNIKKPKMLIHQRIDADGEYLDKNAGNLLKNPASNIAKSIA